MIRSTAPASSSRDWSQILVAASKRLDDLFGEKAVEFVQDDAVATEAPGTFVFHIHVAPNEADHAAIGAAQLRTDLQDEYGPAASRLLFLVLPGENCDEGD